ncbi:MAG: putative sugar O-methyltransferase [Solirubrobacterales bacterium]|nr:putative sugar O-methyltransferase [Solirubrobacterales bacterium]
MPRDLWTMIAEAQQDFARLLARDDPQQLAAYLCNVSRHSASHGIAQGRMEYERIQHDSRYRDFVVRMAHDKLILLAEAVGAIAPDNPEQGELGRGVRSRPEDLVERIEQRLGLTIAPPAVDGAMLKLQTSRGLFGERDLNAIYTAHLLSGLRAGKDAPTSVCEIGGGTGRVALWARRMGLQSYAIIDLPLVNVVQGFYAMKTMPPEDVILYGERPPGSATGCVQILPPHAVDELGDTSFDLFLNQDSMPEMDGAIAARYLAWIARVCREAFVSINHETKPPYGDGMAHVSVPEMVDQVGGLRLQSRYPYWLRRGYVVEIYAAQSALTSAR